MNNLTNVFPFSNAFINKFNQQNAFTRKTSSKTTKFVIVEEVLIC